jgi:leucyl-tRNA synthetase
MGPFDREKLWNTDAVSGCRRFLNRFYEMVFSEKVTDEESEEALKLTHRLVESVSKDIEALQFNTAIAKMMEFLNHFIPLAHYPKSCLTRAVQMLYPFAPHMAEECWEELKQEDLLAYAPIPPIDPKYLIDEKATYIVQINGKLRGRFDLPLNQTEEALLDLVQQKAEIGKYLEGKKVMKTIFVPNKLLNIVTEC